MWIGALTVATVNSSSNPATPDVAPLRGPAIVNHVSDRQPPLHGLVAAVEVGLRSTL
jgi:hypothetical protein